MYLCKRSIWISQNFWEIWQHVLKDKNKSSTIWENIYKLNNLHVGKEQSLVYDWVGFIWCTMVNIYM